jgi:hypothetical protein
LGAQLGRHAESRRLRPRQQPCSSLFHTRYDNFVGTMFQRSPLRQLPLVDIGSDARRLPLVVHLHRQGYFSELTASPPRQN